MHQFHGAQQPLSFDARSIDEAQAASLLSADYYLQPYDREFSVARETD